MNLKEARARFIQAWGTLGSSWGINRTMAQVHALLLISAKPLSAEEIMEELKISRGNANMNVRDLIKWGLVKKELKAGERKEFFVAEKDIHKVFRLIVKERRKRELEPVFEVLDELSRYEGDAKNKDVKAFTTMLDQISDFAHQADRGLEVVIKSDENWFVNTLIRLLK
jgi:DNA-binding transcriptional regulator GbsR (MarR family)